jgi:UDP-glucose 4-epimerase
VACAASASVPPQPIASSSACGAMTRSGSSGRRTVGGIVRSMSRRAMLRARRFASLIRHARGARNRLIGRRRLSYASLAVMGMRILVTGGAGFVGSHLVERLRSVGEELHVIDDLSRGRAAWLAPDVAFSELDVRDVSGVTDVISRFRPTHVVHLAALHFIPAVDEAPNLARSINVDGTRALLDALQESPPEQLVFASTAAVYPNVAGPISEAHELGPIDLYGETKVEGESMLRDFAELTGAGAVVARLFNVIGRRETNPHVLPEIVDQLAGGASSIKLGALDPRRDYVNAADVAAALDVLLRRSSEGVAVFNVGTGCGTSVREIVDTCSEILGRKVTIEHDPSRVRTVDRLELLADASLLRERTGWAPQWTLERTLADLLHLAA